MAEEPRNSGSSDSRGGMTAQEDHPARPHRIGWHHVPHVRSGAELTRGERAADRMRNTMGSWPFVFGFFGVMITWAIANSIFYVGGGGSKHGFDPYPYILLNLFLSMLAGVQAAALLIAAKRADTISAEIAKHTADNTDDIKTLIGENTELTRAVETLTKAIHDHITADKEQPKPRASRNIGRPPKAE